MYFLYRFLNENNDVIYLGRTNDIRRRILKEHFTNNTHLCLECYKETHRVEYTQIKNESEEFAFEAILINKIRPKYNTQFKDNAEFNFTLPEFKWIEFEWNFDGQLELMKKLKCSTQSLHDLLESYVVQAEFIQPYIFTGFTELDNTTIFTPTTTMLISGISGEYKTSYALNIAVNTAKKNRKVLYINLKNDSTDLINRLISKETLIDNKKIILNQLAKEEWEIISSTLPFLLNLPLDFYNIATCGNSLDKIISTIKENSYDLVIIDDLNSVECNENAYDTDKMFRIIKRIKILSVELKIPIISIYCLSSKNIATRTDKHPQLSDLGYSSLSSYNDIIQFLHRDFEQEILETLEVITAKNYTRTPEITKLHCNNDILASFENR